jgi:hypothetical protein
MARGFAKRKEDPRHDRAIAIAQRFDRDGERLWRVLGRRKSRDQEQRHGDERAHWDGRNDIGRTWPRCGET